MLSHLAQVRTCLIPSCFRSRTVIGPTLAATLVSLLAANSFASPAALRDTLTKDLLASRYDRVGSLMDSAVKEGNDLGIHPFTPYETVALHLIASRFDFVRNVDSLEKVYGDEFWEFVSVPRDGLYLNISRVYRTYARSDEFRHHLDSLDAGNRAFVRIVATALDTSDRKLLNAMVEADLERISDTAQKGYLARKVWKKYGPSPWRFDFDLGGGGDLFVGGAEEQLRNTGHMDIGIRSCKKVLCGEFELQIVNAESKKDIVQDGYFFPRMSGPQIIRSNLVAAGNLISTRRFDATVYGGLSLGAFGIAEQQKADYHITQDLEGFSVGYICGLSIDAYLFVPSEESREVNSTGLRFRIAYATLDEPKINGLRGGDLTWSIQMVFKSIKLVPLTYGK